MNGEAEGEVSGKYITKTPSPTYRETSKWLLDNREALVNLEYKLKGFVLTKKKRTVVDPRTGNKYTETYYEWERKGKSYLSDEGAMEIITYLSPFAEKNTILSYRNKDDIIATMRRVHEDLINMLFVNMKRWDTDPVRASAIITMCLNFVYSSLMRALEGGERNIMGNIVEEKEIIHSQEKKKGILDMLPLPK